MKVYLGADHGGYALKERIKEWLKEIGHEVEDCGAAELDTDDDYPVFAKCVGEKVARSRGVDRGIVFCRNGIGISIAVNKVHGIRCAHAESEEIARTSRADDNSNVLAIAADYIDEEDVMRVIETWLTAEFSGEERHKRRIAMVSEMEDNAAKNG